MTTKAEQQDSQRATVYVGKIFLFHMTSGVTVVALIKDVDFETGVYTVTKPTEFNVMPTKTGPAAEFTPFLSMFGALPPIAEMDLDTVDILLPRPAPANVESAYREFTGMVAVPAEKKLIIPGG